jgi:hypothetical protein
VNRYVVACGGDPAKHVYGNTPRMTAVGEVNEAVRRAERAGQDKGKDHAWTLCKERDVNLSRRITYAEAALREIARLSSLRDYQEILKLAQRALEGPPAGPENHEAKSHCLLCIDTGIANDALTGAPMPCPGLKLAWHLPARKKAEHP